MAAAVDIANRAMQKLGAATLTALTDDSRNARACNRAYTTLRDAELEAHSWGFAIKRAALAEDAVAPTWGRGHAYTLPSDFLRLLPPYPEDDTNTRDWLIENGKIYTDDTSPLYIRYVARIESVNEMTPMFREVLAARIALELCEEITQSNQKKAALAEEYERAIRHARRVNAIQRVPAAAVEDPWISARD